MNMFKIKFDDVNYLVLNVLNMLNKKTWKSTPNVTSLQIMWYNRLSNDMWYIIMHYMLPIGEATLRAMYTHASLII